MIPESSRQERIDAIFEQELREKPRDENFKPKLANGGYVTGVTVWGANTTGTNYSAQLTSVHDAFAQLGITANIATAELKKMNAELEKIWVHIDGA